jgi:hypothetical protein
MFYFQIRAPVYEILIWKRASQNLRKHMQKVNSKEIHFGIKEDDFLQRLSSVTQQ